MAILLFKLNAVPDDEAHDIRMLLTDNNIDYYETSAGNWGISLAGIWLRNEAQLEQARNLIDDYELARYRQVRAEYDQRRADGQQRTLVGMLRESPLRFLAYLAAISLILYFSIKPFLAFGT
ncbi:hypothetical protein MNBD_GAMMA24-1383 [hydrothermal vent metagenome]|uniref:DUF2007 domain-containing protein n=1 Tax=hydrothermal vent metagenome TaxID=652676 RepID=A0A3B1BK97_9ZZZZ